MKHSSAAAAVTGWLDRLRSGAYVHNVIDRIEADVAARKRPRTEMWPVARLMGLVGIVVLAAFELGAASVDGGAVWTRAREHSLNQRLQALQGRLDIQTVELERLRRAHDASSRYGIGADLAMKIEEIALAEQIDPRIAFSLIRVESGFNQRAVSPVGALGYTQLMPETARLLSPGITREAMFDQDTNLRLGFRFLRYLINHYHGDIRLALLAYNRGPARVDELLARGIDPGNGYSRMVLGE